MSNIVNLTAARTSLSRLVRDLESGAAASFVIARNGRPVARLLPLATSTAERQRRIGGARGRFTGPASINGENDLVRRFLEGGDAGS